MRLSVRQWIVLGLLLLVLGSFAVATFDKHRLSQLNVQASADDAGVRATAFERIGRQRYHLGLRAVLHALSEEQDRDVLERAGYAAARIEAAQAVPLLQQRVESGPDDTVRAGLATYVARASGRDGSLADWFRTGIESGEPWRRVGAAAGLQELGFAEGGDR